jgi:putative hemolysin
MRIDRRADLSFNSTECSNPHDVNGAPEWRTRHPLATLRHKSPKPPTSRTLDGIGPLEVRLACHKGDVRRLKRLRYRVFLSRAEPSPTSSPESCGARDPFDSICDHLMVLDHSVRPLMIGSPLVIGIYRLLRQEIAEKHGGFYSAEEFDISSLLTRHPDLRFLELARSCVLPPLPNKTSHQIAVARGVEVCPSAPCRHHDRLR